MLILISGGSCSGKSTFAKKIKNALVISMDNFYIGKSKMKLPYNFDHPDAVDLERLYKAVADLIQNNKTNIPIYDMKVSEPVGEKTLTPKKNIVVEGIFVLLHKKLRELADLTIYIEASQDERLKRRIKRDVIKGRNEKETVKFSKNVDKMHELYVEKQKKLADLVLV